MIELEKLGYKVITERVNVWYDRREVLLSKGNKHIIFYVD